MSYILDALRKSDQQRQRGRPPTLQASQAAEEPRTRRVSTAHIALAGGLVCTGILIGVLGAWRSESPPNPVVPKSPDSHASAGAAAQAQLPIKSERVLPKMSISADRTAPPPPSQSTKRRESAPSASDERAGGRAAPRASVDPALTNTSKPAPRKRDTAASSGTAREQAVLTIAELPPAVQQELPRMAFSVHAYSATPKDRLVSINDRVLREGDELAPGLTLESITLDGVILSYKGYRFRRGVR